MSEKTGRDSEKFMLRLPDGMRDRIKSEAERNNRSMNAEIVAGLEHWLSRKTELEIEADKLKTIANEIMTEREHMEHRLADIFDRIKVLEMHNAINKYSKK